MVQVKDLTEADVKLVAGRAPVADVTLAGMFWNRVATSGARPAQMVKRGGQWHTLTWSEVGAIVRELALGLLALGRQPGEKIAILSRTRAEWVQADMAVMSAGCITVPIYATYPATYVAHIVNDSDARMLFVEDAAQLVKALEVRERLKGLERIVVIEGYEGRNAPILAWEELRRLGRGQADSMKSLLAERVAATRPDDVATIVYTSGTTGVPKGVVQTHRNHVAALHAAARVTPVEALDVHLIFLPLAHAFARLEAFMAVQVGLTTAFGESVDKLRENLREVRPHFICGVPRVFEKMRANVLGRVQAGSPIRKWIFSWAMDVGREVSRLRTAGSAVPALLAAKYQLADRLVFRKLHEALGGRLRFAVSGGAPLAREIAEFFHAAGILILEGYGLTETCPLLTFNRLDHFKFGSVGLAIPGVELTIAGDGEILARGPNVATRGYLNQPEATAEAFTPDGWLKTGDIGSIDEDGFVYLIDRKKDLIVTSGGINIAPQRIENLLTADPLISQAMIFGDRRPYPIALLALNPEGLVRFGRERGILVTDPAGLARHPTVLDRVRRTLETKNAELASYARIKKFAVVAVDFTEEAGEVTPTQKVKRKVVAERYRDVIESLYEPSPE